MITKLNLFGPAAVETEAPIVVAQAEKPQVNGWHAALDWSGTAVVFFGFWCEKCHNRCNTPLLRDVGKSYVCIVRHCGREERITIGELLAANLPTARTEPHHATGGNNMIPVGDFGDGDSGITYSGTNAGPKETENPDAQLDGMLF